MTQKLGKNNRTGEKSYYRNKNNKSAANPVNSEDQDMHKPVRGLPK
ncbi:MAG: hypothetical protein ABRQ25_03335 [Clostridiaceae bacterium]